MFGVVLWSDEADRKAVFWCEDQGDLAFYQESSGEFSGFEFFDAGDMVQFEVSMDRKLRKASNARLVLEKACSELPDRLLTTASTTQPVNNTSLNNDDGAMSNVVPFARRSTPSPVPLQCQNA